MISCNTSMVSGQRGAKQRTTALAGQLQPAINNFMIDERTSHEMESGRGHQPVYHNIQVEPYFHKQDMEIESGYPSESDAQATSTNKYSGRPMDYDSLNESKISILPPIIKVRAEQD